MGLFSNPKTGGGVPIWFMRQAGRYLPEYRALRAKKPDFLTFCETPDLAIEATLQPLNRFPLDAAVIFSDILIVPHALGQRVDFINGTGPRLSPLTMPSDIDTLMWDLDTVKTRWKPTLEALTGVRSQIGAATDLIGFVGAPWTLLCYMIDGGGSKTFSKTKQFAHRYPGAFQDLITRLTHILIAYLEDQIAAGATVLQVFDSWASLIPHPLIKSVLMDPHRHISLYFQEKHPNVPVIFFPRGIGGYLEPYVDYVKPRALSIDEMVDPFWVSSHVPDTVTIQGGLDPNVVVVGGAAMENAARVYLNAFCGHPFIFNLGHGLLPETPPENVAALVDFVQKGGM